MDEDTLMGQVQNRARLSTRADAARAVRSTLETLAERIPAGLADNLAAQLPHEVGENLRRVAADPLHESGERFDRDEFIHRISDRAGVDDPQAAYLARVVFEVIDEAASLVMDTVRGVLPEDLQQLTSAGSSGKLDEP
ncbi:Uncharacterized conserved protein, DUF2267 family [Cryobacterium psychrotolerans]|uniref:Uncharacterized conserved protein, DUF2267 family n=1 Tax=Cryobacterium psychrotolerans TaxID=386301 RepID=A0A1G9HR50_9MICO|nr:MULTISPECIES: DUF2267 domain-containing protein [Cryobacterium]TFD42435.1 DUF2267 domain-containing protein [Cryobacterium sp. TMT1-2-1]TFD83948.1 DUF2267 domain-containing protein [Cryobacterium psychrotolerans]SDL15438.1 Uncharacterized conserved protein, DUF2267 family [Cryobacterium psychrotolerans]